MTEKKDVTFNIAALEHMDDAKLTEIIDNVLKSPKGASALKSMMRSVMRSALKSTIKSVIKSPHK